MPDITTLSNGVRVVTHHVPNMNSVSLGIWVSAGNRNETEEQNGIAHFLEHMMFKGTPTRGSKAIVQEIEDVGGRVNAYTSRDVTCYYVNLLKNDLTIGFDIISDIVLNSVFDQKELDAERDVVVQEIQRQFDQPDNMVFNNLGWASYPNQAYGRTILGPESNIRKFTRDDFFDFVDANYGPEQLVVSVSGEVNHHAIVKMAEDALGHLTRRSQSPHEEPIWHEGDVRETSKISQAHFAFAFEGPSFFDPDYYHARLYAVALGGGMSSRLFQKIREEHGLCYSVFASANSHDDTGSFTVYSGTTGEHIKKLSNLVIDEIKASVGDISESELAKSKSILKAGLLMSMDSHSGMTNQMGRQMATMGQLRTSEEVVKSIDSIALEDMNKYTEEFVGQSKAALALYGQVDDAPTLDYLKERLQKG